MLRDRSVVIVLLISLLVIVRCDCITRRVCMTLRREGTCDGNGNSGVDPVGKCFQCRSVFAGRVGVRVP